MGTSRKHARKVARKAVKENRALRGRRVGYVIVDELTDDHTPRPKRDNTPIEARNEAQAHYLISIENKPLTFATGEAGCGKTFLATAVAAQKLLDKEVRKIIVTRPVLQADEIWASFLVMWVRSSPHTSDPSMTCFRSVLVHPSSNTV